uniref:Odorant-binding protein 10 n=1 Tax=Aulacocentrum confusum TaxID=2767324 RepID=A0A7G8Z911_9HYME|nr:odorant-binding protein 10 [Aulacocentrum confusum]
MKTLVVILVVCIVGVFGGLSDEQKEKLRIHRKTCETETGVEKTLVDNAHRGNWAESDPKLRCFAACMLKRMAMMDDSGNFNEAETRKKISSDIPADKVDEVINKCKDMKGADSCETGLKLMKCYNDQRAVIMA